MTDTGSSRRARRTDSLRLPDNLFDGSSRRGHAISPADDLTTAESQFMIPTQPTASTGSNLLAMFGLREPPFEAAHTGWIRLSTREPVVGELVDAITSGRGIAVLVGPTGSGKSAVCEEVSRRLAPHLQIVRLTDAACTTRRALLQAILFGLGVPYVGLTEQESRLRLWEHVSQASARSDGIVIVAEEAERLSDRILEELRSLANFAPHGAAKIRVLLVGDESLEDRLLQPALAAINQRIICQQVLGPVTQSEAARFIDERILQAGGDGWEHVFSRPAMELICLACDGSLRSLCLLADRCLKLAARRKETPVEEATVRTALEQLAELPMHWQIPSRLAGPESLTSSDEPATAAACETPAAEGDYAAAVVEFGASCEADGLTLSESDSETAQLPSAAGATLEIGMFDESGYSSAETGINVECASTDGGAPLANRVSCEYEVGQGVACDSGDDSPVTVPSRGQPTSVPNLAVASASSAGWQELDVSDRYAWLDEPRGKESPLATLDRRVIALSARDCAAEMAEASPPGFADELEDEILEQIHSLRATVSRRENATLHAPVESSPVEPTPAAEPRTCVPPCQSGETRIGMVPLPEWDVIQPEWLHRCESFQPVAVEVSPTLSDEISRAAGPHPGVVQDSAPISEANPPINSQTSTESIPDRPHAAQQTRDSSDSAINPVVAEPAVPASREQCRPYARLFSRLRRRQVEVASRDAG